MCEPFALGPRLQKCADFVRPGSLFVDIGSDHGYLPIWLLRMGKVKTAIAADVHEGPLCTAGKNGKKYAVPIKIRLSDGFQNILPDEIDDAVISGMGGELIAHIIEETPWLKNRNKRLILQPMTASEKLRAGLFKNGFCIEQEEVVMDGEKIYSVLCVSYSGTMFVDPVAIHMGAIQPGSAYSCEYAQGVLKHLKNKCRGYEGATLSACMELIFTIKERYL